GQAREPGAARLRLLPWAYAQGRARQGADRGSARAVGPRSAHPHHSRWRARYADAAMAGAAHRSGSALDRRPSEIREFAMNWRAGLLALCITVAAPAPADELRGTGDLGIVIERADGAVVIVDTSNRR